MARIQNKKVSRLEYARIVISFVKPFDKY